MNISISIPIHNEAGNIEKLYEELTEVLTGIEVAYEMIWVNDGSSDQSPNILNRIAAQDERVKVIHLLRNYGQTYAMMAGFDFASGDIIISMDGDRQNDPTDIPRMLEKIEQGYSVVSGWRKDRKDKALTRILPSKIANWLISYISHVKLHDYGCSLKAYKKEVIKGIHLYGEMHRFIPIYAIWQGGKITEMVVKHRPRTKGSSHYGLERIVNVLLDLILVKFFDKYLQRPIHMFGGLGIISFLSSFLSFGIMLYFKFWGGKPFIETPLPVLCVLFFLVGVISVFMGILAEMVMRTYYESQRQKPYEVYETINVAPAFLNSSDQSQSYLCRVRNTSSTFNKPIDDR